MLERLDALPITMNLVFGIYVIKSAPAKNQNYGPNDENPGHWQEIGISAAVGGHDEEGWLRKFWRTKPDLHDFERNLGYRWKPLNHAQFGTAGPRIGTLLGDIGHQRLARHL